MYAVESTCFHETKHWLSNTTKDEVAHSKVSSLLELCFDRTLKFMEASDSKLNVSADTFLPEFVSEPLIDKKLKAGGCDDDFLCSISARTSRLFKVRVSGATITDRALEVISDHPLREVDISKCQKLSHRAIEHLEKCKNTLLSLNLASCLQISSFRGVLHLLNLRSLDLSYTCINQTEFDLLTWLANLKRLILMGTYIQRLEPVRGMQNLTSLDISECRQVRNIEALEAIRGTLCWLSLYNCTALFVCPKIGNTLEQLTQLQHLDLSKDSGQLFERNLNRQLPVTDGDVLKQLSSLPHLTSLDLSGNDHFSIDDIKPFHDRQQRLAFLGVCLTGLSHHPNLPAAEVTGEANVQQMMLSLKVYRDRPGFLTMVMRELFNVIRYRDTTLEVNPICELVLCTMERHHQDQRIQLAGSASLYHLSREEDLYENHSWVLSQDLKRQVVSVTLSAMENHIHEGQLQKNCCLTLANLRIPDELACDYRRVAQVLLTIASAHKVDFIQRFAIGLCNRLVCQVQDSQKVTVGKDLRGVEIILNIIRHKMNDDPENGGVLECCWSALWNITDETPENCSLFILHGGLELFMECKSRLGNQRDLVRNMLGLMGNVAEVPTLRRFLMVHVHIFYDLLQMENELEVTYNAGGIISHLAFDGAQAWTNNTVSREQALKRLAETINTWDITARRQMSYRSFTPILTLLTYCRTPEVHLWATWALANLCNVDAEKYCKLVKDEGGTQLLEGLLEDPWTPPRIKELAGMTLNKCRMQTENAANKAD